MSVIPIYESEVCCLSSILGLQQRCTEQKVAFSYETNKFLLYLTLKKVGPSRAQKVVSKLVQKGDITWSNDEDFEVEQILDSIEEDGTEFFLIKWKGWSHAHNSWEPAQNLDCPDLIEEFNTKNKRGSDLVKPGTKRKYADIEEFKKEDRKLKQSRVDELFVKLVAAKEVLTPLQLISLTSPDKRTAKSYKGLVSCEGLKVPKFNNNGKGLLYPKTKAYKQKKIQIQEALQDWERHLNAVNKDPAPICVENKVDLEGPPENFEYINDYKAGSGIVIPNDPVIGCECTDCYSEKSQCCPVQFGVEFAYSKKRGLRIDAGRPIYECNKRCKCGPDCSNRVVQNGRKHKVCIFRTDNGRGWGVKAMQKIKQGTFVMEYVGEVISNEEAEIRGKTYDSVGRTYLFDLDFNGDDCPFTVDAAVYGNVSHFVNHSCDPNLQVYSVWINTLDPRMPRIALFSKRDIQKGEELTFDYMSSKVHSPLEESLEGDAIEKDLTEEADVDKDNAREHAEEQSVEMEEDSSSNITKTDSSDSGACSDDGNTVNGFSDEDLCQSKPSEKGAAVSTNKTKSSPKKSPKQQADQYRMVCQCGANNCRKFVF